MDASSFIAHKRIMSVSHKIVFAFIVILTMIYSSVRPALAAPDMALSVENWAREIEPGWWIWGVRLKGEKTVLDKVQCVEYTLHRSFPNPVRTVCSRENNFELQAKGWGTFRIPVRVLFKDGTVLTLIHDLKF